jgi:DNA polymerase-3 subunit beta
MIIFQTTQNKLLDAVQSVAGIIERKHNMPILTHVLIRDSDNLTELTGSDLEIQIRTKVPLSGDMGGSQGPFATTVSARKLIEILRALPAEQTVSVELKDGKAILRANKSKFTLQTLPAEDYPLVKEQSDFGPSFQIPQKTLKHLLDQVAFAMAVHDIRYYLNGILFVAEGNRLALVSTDGHRLAHAAATLDTAVPKQEVILPRKTVIELQRLLSTANAPAGETQPMIEMRFATNQARFSFTGKEFVTKLVEGKFPDFNRVIPKDHEYGVTIARTPLLTSLQRTAILASDKFRGVRMIFNASNLRIITSNADQEEAVDELDIDYDGAEIDTGFNCNYLIDALGNMTSEFVRFNLQDAASSALITLPDDPEFKYVVMPMRI